MGPLQANCYVLWSAKDQAFVIDPGDEGDRLVRWFRDEGVTPRLILNTHGHFDHTGGVMAVKTAFGATHKIHRGEVEILAQLPGGSKLWGLTIPAAPKPDGFVEPGEKIRLPGLEVEAIHTPGHTPGSTCFYVRSAKAVFTGDTLFLGSIGRSDFPGGDGQQLLRSIHERLLTLPPETRVFPGHGPPSTIRDEAENNPFLV